MINNDNKKGNDNQYLEGVDEGYDYMDSLMDDMMSDDNSDVEVEAPEVLPMVEPTVADPVSYKEEVINEEPEVVDEAPVTRRRRRVPLFPNAVSSDVSEENRSEPANLSDTNSEVSIGVEPEVDEDNNVVNSEKEYVEPIYEPEVEVEVEPYEEEVEDVIEPLIEPEPIYDPEVVADSGSFADDMFSDMLDEMVEDINVEPVVEEEYVSDVPVPLETKAMTEAKVTADGRTLADMLPGMRSGRKSVNQVVAEIKNDDLVVDVNGKKFSDDRYSKHVKVINDEKAEQDKRRALSKKFLQRNAKFSTEERIIMENLGVSNKQFTNLMKSTELSQEQKEEVLGLGRYGAERHFNGRRYRTTVGDTAMLEFLVKFKFANTRILRWISNEPQGRTWRKLDRLRDNGLVESQSLIGIPDLWAATTAGVAVSGYNYEPGLRPIPKMATISSSMGINYIAACLWFNSINVLNLDDFPAKNKIIALQEDGRENVRGEMLVSELELRSSLGREITPSSSTMRALGDERLYDVISSNVRDEIKEWRDGGRIGDGPETQIGNEYMWILFPTSQLTLSYHVPDLVVQRERGEHGEPNSIAVEMERYDKSNNKYDQIMLAYKLDEHLYKEVVWITPNARVARLLEQAAQRVGFTRYRIIPIITEFGTYSKPDIWMI